MALTNPALVLHSLRHGDINKLHAVGCPHNIAEVSAGYVSNTVRGQMYVHRERLPLSLLRDGRDKLRHDEVEARLASGPE